MFTLYLKTNDMKYFWNHEYRHEMRVLKKSKQKEILKTFIEFDLEPSGKSDLHYEIICIETGNYTIKD